MTPHIESKLEDIAPLVLMPGDPLRAKYIADNYLTDCKLVNKVRNMLAYTGYYKGVRITVFSSGMGIPSMGIYSYELYNFYHVKKIIRIGTCGSFNESIHLLDVVLAKLCYSESTFAYLSNLSTDKIMYPSIELNNKLLLSAHNNNVNLREVNVLTTDGFDEYVDYQSALNRLPVDLSVDVAEMETFALFHLASRLNKEASAIYTVVDSHHTSEIISSDDRQSSLNNMFEIALDAIIL